MFLFSIEKMEVFLSTYLAYDYADFNVLLYVQLLYGTCVKMNWRISLFIIFTVLFCGALTSTDAPHPGDVKKSFKVRILVKKPSMSLVGIVNNGKRVSVFVGVVKSPGQCFIFYLHYSWDPSKGKVVVYVTLIQFKLVLNNWC